MLVDLLVIAIVITIALATRFWNLSPYGWVPDHYERFEDAQRIAHAQFPHSHVYPPGPSLLFSPFVALWPNLLTTQVVICLFSVGLIFLGIRATVMMGGTRIASILAAAAISFDPLMIFTARQGYVDVLNTFLLGILLLSLPGIRTRPSLVWLAMYGLGLGLLFSIRPTNLVILPVLGFYALMLSGYPTHVRLLWTDLRRPIIAIGIIFSLCSIGTIAAGSWFGGGYSSDMLNLAEVPSNILPLARSLFRNPLGVILLLPPAVMGWLQLRRRNSALAWTLLLFLVLWSLIHLPFNFFNYRYMLPNAFIIFVLASLGWSALHQPVGNTARAWRRLYGFGSCGALLLIFLVVSTLMVWRDWSAMANNSDAGMARKFAPFISELEAGSLVVSVVADAVRTNNQGLVYMDLFDLSTVNESKEMGGLVVTSQIHKALADCQHVYYLYSQSEAREILYGGIWDNFSIYFEAVSREFKTVEVHRLERTGDHEPWILYRIFSEANGLSESTAAVDLTPSCP